MKTHKLGIYSKHSNQLVHWSSLVNHVRSGINELSFTHLQKTGKFFCVYDLNQHPKSSGESLGLHFQTIQAINESHTKNRKPFKKTKQIQLSLAKGQELTITVKNYPKVKCGLDLDCEAVITSQGDKFSTKFTQKYAKQLAMAQKARKKTN